MGLSIFIICMRFQWSLAEQWNQAANNYFLYFNWNLAFASHTLPFHSYSCAIKILHLAGARGVWRGWQLVVAAARVHCNANCVYAMFASVVPESDVALALSLSPYLPTHPLIQVAFILDPFPLLAHSRNNNEIRRKPLRLLLIKPCRNLVSKMQLKSQAVWKKCETCLSVSSWRYIRIYMANKNRRLTKVKKRKLNNLKLNLND